MKDLTDEDVFSSWYDSKEVFVVQFDPDLVEVVVGDEEVLFRLKRR